MQNKKRNYSKVLALVFILGFSLFGGSLFAAPRISVLIVEQKPGTSDLPLSLPAVAGKPILFHILAEVHQVLPEAPIRIVGETVTEISDALESLPEGQEGVLVLSGNCPLVSARLLTELIQPLDLGQDSRLVVNDVSGKLGLTFYFKLDCLREILEVYQEENSDHESHFWLGSLVGPAKRNASLLSWFKKDDFEEVHNFLDLSVVHRIMIFRLIKKWAKKGVFFLDPNSTQIDASVQLEAGVVIYPGVILKGDTVIGKGSVIGPHSVLTDAIVGENVNIKVGSVIEKSKIGAGSQVGPYAHLRPESEAGERVNLGNFVELKKTRVGDRSAVAHLSYLGDAEVGQYVNVGGGFITCNYDGRVRDGSLKHPTVIGDRAFVGSACQAVAPVRIGAGSILAAGSTITDDVEADSMAIARSRQVNKSGYARKFRGEG